MDNRMKMSVVMGLVVLMVAMKGERVSSQASNSCISEITACGKYVNTTTKPPKECCDPLLKVINTDVECLCNVLKSGIINSLGFTLQQALALPSRCGQTVTTGSCYAGAPTSTPTGNPPAGESSTTINSAVAISISTLIAMTLLTFLQGFH